MLEVYLDPATINSRKVLAALDLVGQEYHFNKIDYFAGGQKDPSFTKINPHATVPAATDGDLMLPESNAIMAYAADLQGGKAYPKDLKTRAKINAWLLWESSVWFGTCYKYVVEYVVKPLLKAEPDQSVIDAEAPNWNKNAGILDATLAKSKFLVGNEPSIADIAVAAPMHLWKASRLPIDKYPNLQRWYKAIEQLPSWQKTQAAVNNALTPGM